MSGELSNVIENWLLILEMFIFLLLLHSGLSYPANLIMKGWVMARKGNPDHVQQWSTFFWRWNDVTIDIGKSICSQHDFRENVWLTFWADRGEFLYVSIVF